ncbi:hypothetical protein CPB85DRAFT_1257906 [Mucidula mucida]|nr:hypothetical protein CPB85DRAFT_1257906 [Mucidula mucida]
MAGSSSQPLPDLWEQQEFELGIDGYSDIPISRPRGRPRQDTYHVHTSLAGGPYETEQRDHVLQADTHGGISSHALPTAKRPKIRPKDLDDAFAQMDFEVKHDSTPMDVPPPPDAMDVDDDESDGEDYEEGYEQETQTDTGKRKQSGALDTPMAEWLPWLYIFLEESLRRHGLGNATLDPKCCKCGACMVPSAEAEADRVSEPVVETACGGGCAENGGCAAGCTDTTPPRTCTELYCCLDCGEFFECLECSLDRHAWSPLHVLQVWRDESWHRTSLRDMGLVYQVGHQGGRCIYPDKTPRLMTVLLLRRLGPREQMAATSLKWVVPCKHGVSCDMRNDGGFETLLPVESHHNRQFLERMTDPYGTEYTPDRYKVFARISRQWTFLERVWRSGSVDEKYHYRYQGMYSVDTNFRMNCKMRPEPRPDLPLYDGLGVQMPTEMYHDWLCQYITEEDVTSCISFAALMQKDTRFSVGLRWSGVLGVICARHEIMLGLGDLQKGELYKNTDFVLYTVLSRMGLKEITVTYDIACQYKKHFFERIKALPPALQDIMGELPNIQWALPVWHGNVHEVKCEASESLKFKVGVGKTDGEGIERVWAVLNPFSYMTKEQLPGARHDNIEDKINYHNFTKNINLGKTLLRRLKIALEERARQVASFDEVNGALKKKLRGDWTQMVLDWIADNTKPNPYAPSGKMKTSEAEVRRDLQKQEAEEEAADLAAGVLPEDEAPPKPSKDGAKGKKKKTQKKSSRMSAAGFLILGLQIQDGQRRLILDKTTSANPTLAQESKIHQRRRVITAKIKEFRKWQVRYMPGVEEILEEEEEARREKGSAALMAEDIKLWLPSECASHHCEQSKCPDRLFDNEAALRKGQCADALARLRAHLLANRYMINYRNAESRGQKATTRASKLLETIRAKIKEATKKYRDGRAALVCLVGEEGCGAFCVLEDSDVKVYKTEEDDAEAVKKLGRLDGRDSKVTGTGREKKQDKAQDKKFEKQKKKKTKRRDAPGETKQTMSWIWTADGGPDAEDDGYLHKCVRIEWAKALAQKTWWTEEVEILKEEMRRVLRSLAWEASEWSNYANRRPPGLSHAAWGGRRAYVLSQAKARVRIRTYFEKLWLASSPARGKQAGPMDGIALEEMTILVVAPYAVLAQYILYPVITRFVCMPRRISGPPPWMGTNLYEHPGLRRGWTRQPNGTAIYGR